MPDKAKELVTYFENTYYIGSTKRIGRKQRKMSALYSPSAWNVLWKQICMMVTGQINNNQCEGWNHRLLNLIST